MSEEQATYQCSLSAQELRIGNWVYEGERTQFPMQVVAIGKDWAHLDFPGNEGGVWEADIKDLRAIPITKEILKKAGFCWDGCYWNKNTDDFCKSVRYYEDESRLRVWYADVDITFHSSDINYLHELQNAYFMATGEEMGYSHEDRTC